MSIVTKSDLKGNLKRLPLTIVQQIADEQFKVQESVNLQIFQYQNVRASANVGGFDWEDTIQGYDYWNLVLGGDTEPSIVEGSLVWCPSLSNEPLTYINDNRLVCTNSDEVFTLPQDTLMFLVSKPNAKRYKKLSGKELSWGVFK